MQALLFCGIIYNIIYWRELSMEDPWQLNWNFTWKLFIDCFDIIERLFLGDWNVNGIVESLCVEQKAEEGDKKYIRLLRVLEQPNHFLSTIQVGITLITIVIWGESCG